VARLHIPRYHTSCHFLSVSSSPAYGLMHIRLAWEMDTPQSSLMLHFLYTILRRLIFAALTCSPMPCDGLTGHISGFCRHVQFRSFLLDRLLLTHHQFIFISMVWYRLPSLPLHLSGDCIFCFFSHFFVPHLDGLVALLCKISLSTRGFGR